MRNAVSRWSVVACLWSALALSGCSPEAGPAPGTAGTGGTPGSSAPAPRTRVTRDLQAPWLAEFPDAASQFRFTHLVQNLFLKRGKATELTQDGKLRVVETGVIHELGELAASVAELDPNLWGDAIAAHFGAVDATLESVGDLATIDWATVKPKLRVRLFAESFLAEAGFDSANALMRSDLPGLATCVMIDAERSATLVPRSDLDEWKRPADGVFEVAIANTKKERADSIQVVDRDAGPMGTLRTLAGPSFYTASAVLWLDDWPDLVGAEGAFVAVPWWGTVFAWPFETLDDKNAVPGLHAIASDMTGAEGERLSGDVYWRRPDGTFGRIRIERDEAGRLSIVPPADLAKKLKDG